MSRHSSSPAENVLGMLFTACCILGLLAYRLYKHHACQGSAKAPKHRHLQRRVG